jgi:adenine-specific DNA-methyltransferase
MSESYKKLIKTLQTIFEMDKADLDFGIYRIMNQKRDDINKFLEDDLLPQVKQAFDDYSSEGQGDLQQELSTAIEQAKNLGAPDPENVPTVLEIKEKMANAVDATALENDVFSKLHTFFSRYYDQGDFISQRRYKADTYAIPYQGEEVKLYWANHDQYYIKSSEHLRDYAFLANDDKKSVRIKLMEADTEKDNIKAKAGEERRFVLDEECPLSKEDGELLIHFNFVPAGTQTQDRLNGAAVETILTQEGFDEWLAILKAPAPTEAKPKRTLMERHLNEYTARNTFDYFIHKDLGGFLNRELDFFIKNEVLFLDDIDDAAFSVTEQQLRKIKIIRSIAKKVIRMLAQLEDFQKKLWLKKKFVIETNYCITLDRIPFNEKLFEEIFSNEEQLAEWIDLFSIDSKQLDKDYEAMEWTQLLEQDYVKFLPVDSKHFVKDFKDNLVSSIEDLDSKLLGLVINSDNSQALNLIQGKLKSNVDMIYIDPPYNTSASEILYKNNYKHSSWLSMMSERISLGKMLLAPDAMHCTTIDDVEAKDLFRLLDDVFGRDMSAGIVPIKINPSGRPTEKGFALTHEYAAFHRSSREAGISKIPRSDAQLSRFDQKDSESIFEWRNLRREGSNSNRSDGQRQFYPIYGNIETGSVRVPKMKWSEGKREWFVNNDSPTEIEVEIYPVNDQGREKNWRWSEASLRNDYSQFLARTPRGGTPQVYYKYRPNTDGVTPLTMWVDSKFSATEHGTKLLKKMFKTPEFTYPKSIHAVEECMLVSGIKNKTNSIVLDYFSGSGTTGNAVINFNRQDNGERKYILCEMGRHFDGTVLPRLKKSSYSAVWKEGRPLINGETFNSTSNSFKYIRLESYEDALNNLDFISPRTNKDLLKDNQSLNEDYMLGYWLDVETTDSSSLLNVQQFEDPFNYKLNIGSGSVGATKPTTVDLVETFNYLIGLTVKTIDVLKGFKLVTGTNPQRETVLVVWRNIKENDNAVLESFLDKQGYNPRDTEFDHIYVNGDHTLEDPQSKVKMTEIEFKRLMFDVSDV